MQISGPWRRAAEGAMLLDESGAVRPTIFAEMSALAAATGAINLGQGFPDEDGPVEVLEAARQAIREGANQYPPGTGMGILREAIAEHQLRFYGLEWDPGSEVLVTAGATEALAATLLALAGDGDEVVVFEPFYDSYAAVVALSGARLVAVPLHAPDWQPDPADVRAAVSDRTAAIVVNSPHNPTGSILDRSTLELLVELADAHDATLVTDEVYEHLTFGVPHVPLATIPGARERTVSISSGGKTFRTTGWKIGWITATADHLTAILAVKQWLTFANGAPFQPAIATGLRLPDAYFSGAADDLRAKRDLLSDGLRTAGFEVLPSRGGYFVIADAAPLGFDDAAELCRRLPDLAGVVGIPLTAFVRPERHDAVRSLVRFAFCKRREVLEAAGAQLAGLEPEGSNPAR